MAFIMSSVVDYAKTRCIDRQDVPWFQQNFTPSSSWTVERTRTFFPDVNNYFAVLRVDVGMLHHRAAASPHRQRSSQEPRTTGVQTGGLSVKRHSVHAQQSKAKRWPCRSFRRPEQRSRTRLVEGPRRRNKEELESWEYKKFQCASLVMEEIAQL